MTCRFHELAVAVHNERTGDEQALSATALVVLQPALQVPLSHYCLSATIVFLTLSP